MEHIQFMFGPLTFRIISSVLRLEGNFQIIMPNPLQLQVQWVAREGALKKMYSKSLKCQRCPYSHDAILLI